MLTIRVNDEVLRRVRKRALEQGTSIQSLLRVHLEALVATGADWNQATDNFLRFAANATSASGGRRWTRQDLHDR
jgi:hypothetical protein